MNVWYGIGAAIAIARVALALVSEIILLKQRWKK